MTTYSTLGVPYGEPSGTYGDLGASLAPVPTPTYAVGASARSSVSGADARTGVSGGSGRSTVTGPPGTTVTTRRTRERIG